MDLRKVRVSKRFPIAVITVAVVVWCAAGAAEAEAADNSCSCLHDTAICISNDNVAACVYLLNVFRPDVQDFQRRDITEKELVDSVLRKPQRGGLPNYTRFLQVAPNRTAEERVSPAGAIVVRAYDNGTALKISAIKNLELRLNGVTQELSPADGATSTVLFLDKPLEGARLGDKIEIDVLSDGRSRGKRYSWYRPMDGWAVDYSLIGLALSWPSWKLHGEPEISVVPAMIEYQYRHYAKDGRLYIFFGAGIGPNLVISNSQKDNGQNGGGNGLNGLVAAATMDLNGFKIGLGTRWSWSESRLDPMITLSLTEAVARGLGITGSVPAKIIGRSE